MELQAIASSVVSNGSVRHLNSQDFSVTDDVECRPQILNSVFTQVNDEGSPRIVADVEQRLAAQELRLATVRAGDPQPAIAVQGYGAAIRQLDRAVSAGRRCDLQPRARRSISRPKENQQTEGRRDGDNGTEPAQCPPCQC